MQKMKLLKLFIPIVLLILLFSCEKASLAPEPGELEGIWVQSDYDEDLTIFSKKNKLDDDKYGFKISDGGIFLEHKNSGWCGTPPISYADYEGTWKYESDSVLIVDVGYWGGTMTYKMQIVELTANKLKTRYIYED